jgi:hypothetical protein
MFWPAQQLFLPAVISFAMLFPTIVLLSLLEYNAGKIHPKDGRFKAKRSAFAKANIPATTGALALVPLTPRVKPPMVV